MVEAVVEFEYEAEQGDELTLHVGDIVKNIVRSEGGWWEGELNDKKGMFPENFVKIIKSEDKSKPETDGSVGVKKSAAQRKSVRELANKFKDANVHLGPMPPPKTKEVKKKCKVSFDYIPENDDELELQAGEVIDFIREVEDGWWEGTLNGKTGVFPSNFCEMVEEPEEPAQPPVAADRPANPVTGPHEEPTAEPVSEIKGKKVIGIGLGNIFEGGPIKLRKAKGEYKVKTEKPLEPKEPSKPTDHGSTPPPVPSTPVPQVPLPTEPEVVKRETKDKSDKAIVRFSYTAEQPDELSLETGQMVNILDMKLEDDGWWKGELNGKIGVFPDNFVELVVESKPKRPVPPVVNTASKTAPTPGHKPVSANQKGGIYPKLPDKVPVTNDSKKHELQHETKHDVKHEPKHETKHEPKHETKFEPKLESVHGIKKESTESVSTNTVTSKRAGPPPVSKKPPSVKQDSSRRSSYSRPDSRELLSSKDIKTKETKHLDRDSRSEDENLADTDEDLENLETSGNKLVHLTATRPKAPKKRPPSSFITPGDNDVLSPEDKPTPNIHDLAPPSHHNKHETDKQPAMHHGKHTRDVRHVGHGENEKKSVSRDQSNNVPPPRPPEPAVGGDHVPKAFEDLQKEFRKLQASMVSKSEHLELKSVCDNLRSELDTVKSTYSKKIRELMMEVDEEKKLRLATQVEIERIKKLLAESHV